MLKWRDGLTKHGSEQKSFKFGSIPSVVRKKYYLKILKRETSTTYGGVETKKESN